MRNYTGINVEKLDLTTGKVPLRYRYAVKIKRVEGILLDVLCDMTFENEINIKQLKQKIAKNIHTKPHNILLYPNDMDHFSKNEKKAIENDIHTGDYGNLEDIMNYIAGENHIHYVS